MENRDRTENQGGQGQVGKPNQGGSQQGGGEKGSENDRGRQDQGGGKGGARPSPSGAPNEGRGTEDQGGQGQAARPGQGAYEYKGGRQGTSGIPNPDDQDDIESAGSFRGTADQDTGTDDDEQALCGQNGGINRNTQNRQPTTDPNQRGAGTSEDKTRNPT